MDPLDSLDTVDYPSDPASCVGFNEPVDRDVQPPSAQGDDRVAAASSTVPAVLCFKLENYKILEQVQDFYLLQDPVTTLFYIWSTATEQPIFLANRWSSAYRMWLEIRQPSGQNGLRKHLANCPPTPSSQDLHDWVNHHQGTPAFGQLVYRRDRRCEDLLQYAVQLSDTVALRWTAGDTLGMLVLEPISRRQHRPAKWIEPQPQSVIAIALHCAIEIFHQHWAYSPYQFNSEHWARLVGTGHCCSFQGDEILSSRSSLAEADTDRSDYSERSEHPLPDFLECNLEAESCLTAAIAAHPEFIQNPSRVFTP